MTRINTNVGSLIAQKTLARTNTQLQTALTRLSTGLRINSGKDDPAGLIASEALGSDIASTQRAITNSQRANQVIATADGALGQVSGLLNSIRGLVIEAANNGAMSDDQIAANQIQIDSSLEAINRIAQTTQFQGKRLLDGSLDFNTTSAQGAMSTVRDLKVDLANLGATGQTPVNVDISAAATQAKLWGTITPNGAAAQAVLTFDDDGTGVDTLTIDASADGAASNGFNVSFEAVNGLGTTPYVSVEGKNITIYVDDTAPTALSDIETAFNQPWVTGFTATAGGTGDGDIDPTGTDIAKTAVTSGGADEGDLVFELSGSKGSQVFNFKDTTALADVVSAINLVKDATGVEAADDSGKLKLSSVDYGSNASVSVKVLKDAGGFAGSLNLGDDPVTPTYATRSTGTDIEAKVNGTVADGNGNTLSISTATLQMTATVNDGDSTDFAFTITGGGALFQLGPNVVSTQQARIGIQSFGTSSLGGKTGRLFELGTGQTASLTRDPNTAAQIVDEALGKVTSLRGRLGAFQSTTLDTNINTLNDTLTNLTDAQSLIRDADFASESANLTRAQILVQSGTSVLAIANQNPQNVLALLK